MPNPTSIERKEFLLDVFITALEGGIGYWALCDTYYWSTPDGKDDVDGFLARVCDFDEPDEVFLIDSKVIAKGLNRLTTGKVEIASRFRDLIRTANRENDGGLIDSVLADIIVQAGLFNEIIYS